MEAFDVRSDTSKRLVQCDLRSRNDIFHRRSQTYVAVGPAKLVEGTLSRRVSYARAINELMAYGSTSFIFSSVCLINSDCDGTKTIDKN
jgi:hypothetical protein